MKICKDVVLANDFDFYGGAVYTALHLTDKEIETIFKMLDEDDQVMSDTELNDIFWFERDWIAEALGYTDWEELLTDRD